MNNGRTSTIAGTANRAFTLTRLFNDGGRTSTDALPRIDLSDTRHPRSIRRRIGAVFAGFVAIFILSTATDVVLHATGVFPPWGQPMADALFVLALAYRTVYCVAGCYLTARLAPDRPMSHALALGLVGVAVSLAATIATWNAGPAFGPKWYPISLIVIAMPCAWAGGRIWNVE